MVIFNRKFLDFAVRAGTNPGTYPQNLISLCHSLFPFFYFPLIPRNLALLDGNKMLLEAKETASTAIQIHPLQLGDISFASFGVASFASAGL